MDEKQLAKIIEKLLETDESVFANKSLDYLDGKQIEWMEKALNHPQYGRRKWRERGMKPLFRNITAMIVEKSGLLFNGKPPVLDVFEQGSNSADEVQSAKLQEMLEAVDWLEYFTNFDIVVRLLKTAMVLVQYDEGKKKLVFDILHRGNSGVILNENHEISMLVYELSEGGGREMYRIMTPEQIIDVAEEEGDKFFIDSIEPNPYGIIPVAAFYDTRTPRCGFWVEPSEDLVTFNETYNFHLIDTDFAASWAKLQTLFTNCQIESGTAIDYEVVEVYGSALPRTLPVEDGLIGGPNRIVTLNTTGVDNPFVEYKGPQINLNPIDEIFSTWVRDFAADWSVRVKSSGEGVADSGFKLMVEEMDNLELRKKRQRMFEGGFSRLFEVIKVVVNYNEPGTFSDTAKLYAKFSDPKLPVDSKAEEEMWSLRIKEGRASNVDYYREVYGMSTDEAIRKVEEVRQFNLTLNTPDSSQGSSGVEQGS